MDQEKITWPGYESFNMIKLLTPHDPHSLFHAVCMGFFKPYMLEEFNGCKISRLQIVTNLRRELADKLAMTIPHQKVRYFDFYFNHPSAGANAPLFNQPSLSNNLNTAAYASLLNNNNSNAPLLSTNAPLLNNSPKSMMQVQAKLRSNDPITFGFFNLLSHQINKDIFILHEDGKLVPCQELVYKGRTAIILYYHNDHFDLVGVNYDDVVQTHFRPTHDLIRHLTTMML